MEASPAQRRSAGALPELCAWRASVMDVLLPMTSLVAAPMAVMVAVELVTSPARRLSAVARMVSYFLLVVLAALPRIDPRLRAWSLVLLGQATAAVILLFGGAGGHGWLFLLAVTMVGLILLGVRAGLLLALLSTAIFVALCVAAQAGWTAEWVLPPQSPVTLGGWVYEGGVFLLCLAVVVTLQGQYARFLVAQAADKARLLESACRSEDFYRTVSELSSDFLYSLRVEPEGRLVGEWTTDAFARITGFDPAHLTWPGHWVGLVHPDDLPLVERSAQVWLTGQETTITLRIVTADGQVRWLRNRSRPVWDEGQGRVVRVCGAVQDVTDQVEAEAQLRRSEEMARAVLDATAESILLVDDQLVVLAVNETAAERFGLSVEELEGMDPGMLVAQGMVPPDLMDARAASARQVLRIGRPMRFEDERNGVIFDVNIYPVLGADGRVTRLAICARDVTARRQAEHQATRAERLAALGRLAATVAHEINNPLQAIVSNLDLVLDFGLRAGERREHLLVIREEIERLRHLAQRLLDLAHPPDAARYPVAVEPLVRRMLTLVGPQLKAAGISAVVDLAPDLPEVLAAPEQIVQVLLNLALNSLEDMPDGGSLRVSSEIAGDVLVLIYSNDSPHIPPEYIASLFDPFVTTKSDGTGLGLAVSDRIIREHGGTMEVMNLEGDRGVAFRITLPLADAGGS
jgi:PAS domain S-box-containing protein